MVTKEYLDRLYEKMPGTETVTLTTLRGKNSDTTVNTTVRFAWQRSITTEDIQLGPLTAKSEGQVWHIPASLIPAAGIQNGDKITDSDGTVWTVMSTELVRMRTCYRCVCREER